MTVKQYFKNVIIGVDQLKNALLFGDPDETISSRLGKAQRGDFGRKWQLGTTPVRFAVDVIFYPFDGWGHCAQSVEDDEGKHDIVFK